MQSGPLEEARDCWNRLADDWLVQVGDEGDGNRRLNSDPVLWELAGDVRGLAVLDAGCGTGYLSRKLCDRGAVVTGVDFAGRMVEIARSADPQGKKLLVLLVDNAGWHTARRLRVPANAALFRLPVRAPELRPVEPLWPLLREAVANREMADLAELEARVRRRAAWLAEHPEVARGAVGFHWAVALAG